ncbi:recombination protein NinG [Gallibacterium salpingitidis]|uniref:recombination protein NinG n=1 Tax=Gallibacterium salpingitidis TaxID=505341 RepID=UPI00266ED79C|nr:recombination protein NinG [Gallibacterium salpingitidis]WKS98755.1 recombination protein NinG [Gallibacterium salpingitidis]
MVKSKQYKCKVCGSYYTKTISSLQKVCSVECAIKLSKEQSRKRREKLDKQARLESKKRLSALKEKNKTKWDLIKEAQAAVNHYIRVRDENKECISCGTPLISEKLGGGFDAGHYRSRGAAPHLRFYTLNIHGQCKRCNRYLGGNYHEYRVGLIERLGIKKVEEIEADNRERKYTEDDLRRIKQIFNKKIKLIQKRRGG